MNDIRRHGEHLTIPTMSRRALAETGSGRQTRRSAPVLALIGVLLCPGTDVRAGHAYQARMLPPDASPAWRVIVDHNRSAQRFAWANDGLLTVYTHESHDNLAWTVGSWDGPEGTDVFRVDSDRGVTVDFRLREIESSTSGVFQLQVSDGRHYWTLFFDTGRVLLHRGKSGRGSVAVRHDNTPFSTFRFAVRGDQASVYVAARDEPLMRDLALSGVFDDKPRHSLTFGDFSSGANGRFDLSFVRWSTEAAELSPPPSPSPIA